MMHAWDGGRRIVFVGNGVAAGGSGHRWPRFVGRLLGYLRTSGLRDQPERTGPFVSIMLVAGGNIEGDDHRHVALCAGRAMQSVLLLVILR